MVQRAGVAQPPGRLELPPRAFTQCINPIKRATRYGDVLRRAESDRAVYESALESGRPVSGLCNGHFWDSKTKRYITVNMGVVVCRLVFAYRAAPSSAVVSQDDLSRVEGAASCAEFSAGAERPQALAEDAPQAGENCPGPYVIPGQSLMGETKAQKMCGQSPTDETFEWSLEKCEAEAC